jgi:hypothetical protein
MRKTLICLLLFLLPIALLAKEPLECLGLKAFYDTYNANYFGGKLPSNTVVEYGEANGAMAITMKDGGHFRIIINKTFNPVPRAAHLTLLHEQCHIASWQQELDDHGPRFQHCMRTLALEGAFDELW